MPCGYLAFFRHRGALYAHLEPIHGGLVFALIVLGAGCVVFGVLPGTVIGLAAAPAASALLHRQLYATGVLGGNAPLPPLTVHFDYAEPANLLVALGSVAVGAALAVLYLRIPEPAPIRWLRAVHAGSVNDYAGFVAVGMVGCAVVLML